MTRDRRPAGIIGWCFVAGAALVTVLFFRGFLFRPDHALLGPDLLLEGFPLRQFFVDELRAGRGVPLWTPHLYGGMPFVASLPGPLFYPTTLLWFVMPLTRAIGWAFVLHVWWSGVFAYFMARSFRLRPWAAVITGTCFMLTGYLTSQLFGGHDGRVLAMALVPLALGCLERALRGGGVHWYVGFAVTLALQVFTPNGQIAYFTALASGLWVVFHLAVRVRVDADFREEGAGRLRPYALPATSFALALLGAAALAAVQLLPTLALLGDVTRSAPETGYAFASSGALPGPELTALFLPDLIGSLDTYWGEREIKTQTEFLGGVSLALALLAIAASVGGRMRPGQRRTVWFLAGATTLGLLFTLGAATPVHRIATLLPLMSSFRAPAHMMSLVALSVALLAGYGWEAVLSARGGADAERPRRASAVLWLLAAPILTLSAWAIAAPAALLRYARLNWFEPGWPQLPGEALEPLLRLDGLLVWAGFLVAWGVGWAVARGRVPVIATLGVVLFGAGELWRVGARHVPMASPGLEWTADPIIERLVDQVAPGERIWAAEGTYGPNDLSYWGLPSAMGAQKFQLKTYARLVGAVAAEDGFLRHPNLLPFFRIRYLVTTAAQPGLTPLLEAGGRRLYEIPAPPHGYFPADVAGVPSSVEAADATRANPDPLGLAVVETPPGGSLPDAGEGRATVVLYERERVELDVTAERGGLLVVSDPYHAGWRAFVDDMEVPVWRANVAFRGVEVPVGEHRVRFEYRSRAFAAGRWLSSLASVSLLALALWSWVGARRRATARAAGDDA